MTGYTGRCLLSDEEHSMSENSDIRPNQGMYSQPGGPHRPGPADLIFIAPRHGSLVSEVLVMPEFVWIASNAHIG